MKKIVRFLSDTINSIKQSINQQIQLYKQRVFIRRKKTKLKTVIATAFYLLSFIILIPSFIHVLFDMSIHSITMTLSFCSFRVSEAL